MMGLGRTISLGVVVQPLSYKMGGQDVGVENSKLDIKASGAEVICR